MKKRYIIGLLVVIVIGGTYAGFKIISVSNSSISPEIYDSTLHRTDSLSILVDTSDALNICSFNIQFLGHFKSKEDEALADMLKNFDIVVVQELVASPFNGTYPDGSTFTADSESAEFFTAMSSKGFNYSLSEEDTGPGETIHKSTTATEWWVTFYKPEKVVYVTDLPHGFLADDRSHNPDYERVPYAFSFRSIDSTFDFVLISVHLAPDASESDRRKHELASISSWIDSKDDIEKDFIILGDMNIEDADELRSIIPTEFVTLNDECRRTNTLINDDPGQGAKPYGHIMYRPEFTSDEIDEGFDVVVFDLIDLMKPYWTSDDPYPGEPYNHNLFKQYYSDHHPILFRLKSNGDDD